MLLVLSTAKLSCLGSSRAALQMLGCTLQVSQGVLLTMWLALQCSVMCCRSEAEAKVVARVELRVGEVEGE